jgi:hypothetical protein
MQRKFSYAIALGALLAIGWTAEAQAKPVRSNGQPCDSTGTARRTGTDQATGEKLDCLFDTCTFTECSTSGGQVSNCVKKTEYSNARDCKAAAASTGPKAGGAGSVLGGSKLKMKAN